MRGTPLWIIGRIGILICFVVVPIIRIRERHKWDTYHQYIQKADKYLDAKDTENAGIWIDKATQEGIRITGNTNWGKFSP